MKHKEVGQPAEEHYQYAAAPPKRRRGDQPPVRYVYGIDDPQPEIDPAWAGNGDK
jgi:hypothetical protein